MRFDKGTTLKKLRERKDFFFLSFFFFFFFLITFLCRMSFEPTVKKSKSDSETALSVLGNKDLMSILLCFIENVRDVAHLRAVSKQIRSAVIASQNRLLDRFNLELRPNPDTKTIFHDFLNDWFCYWDDR